MESKDKYSTLLKKNHINLRICYREREGVVFVENVGGKILKLGRVFPRNFAKY